MEKLSKSSVIGLILPKHLTQNPDSTFIFTSPIITDVTSVNSLLHQQIRKKTQDKLIAGNSKFHSFKF